MYITLRSRDSTSRNVLGINIPKHSPCVKSCMRKVCGIFFWGVVFLAALSINKVIYVRHIELSLACKKG